MKRPGRTHSTDDFASRRPTNQRWQEATIHEATWTKPVVGGGSPLRLAQGAQKMGRVLAGLRAEWEGARDAAHVHPG